MNNIRKKIACVGNSITFGWGLKYPRKESYPSQLSAMLGEKYIVKNFGVCEATLLYEGTKPYSNSNRFNRVIKFNPNIILIKLGTNDSTIQNWKYKNNFLSNYINFIEKLRLEISNPKILICLPLPIFSKNVEMKNSIIIKEIIPLLYKVGKKANCKVINIYDALKNKKEFFPDFIHPNIDGAEIIAKTVYKKITT